MYELLQLNKPKKMNYCTMISGNDVKRLRAVLGINQKELAKKLGVSTRTVANYEAGGVIPANKQLMIDSMLETVRNVTITGDGNISNTGIVEGGFTVDGNQDIRQLKARIKELENEVKELKNDKAILQEFVTFLQNKK